MIRKLPIIDDNHYWELTFFSVFCMKTLSLYRINDYLCRMMTRKGRKRVFIAWVLLLALMPISIVKATHFHDGGGLTVHNTTTQSSQNSDGGANCPICHFFLSPFIETPEIFVSFCATIVAMLIVGKCPELRQADVLSPTLRAPPCANLF